MQYRQISLLRNIVHDQMVGPCWTYRAILPRLVGDGNREPTGTEYHVDMSRISPQCFDTSLSTCSVAADILFRQEPEEEEDEEEDERDRKERDEDEDTNDGYSE
jgi:hypothetical protein